MSKVYKMNEGKRVYAIGDVHGYADVLRRMHDKIEEDLEARPVEQPSIVYLGDYIDRGPDSKGVIDILIERPKIATHIDHVFLLGNHEDAMINEFLVDPNGHRQDWLQWGGEEAAASYGVYVDKNQSLVQQAERIAKELSEALPCAHQEFLKNLQLHHVVDDYLFVHAGIRPNVSLEKQIKQDMTYTREPFMSHEDHHDYYVVHGHSATRNLDVDIRPNRINLDSGLYNGGPLSCAVIEEDEIRILQVRQS